jgi:hypothetical protein
MSCLLSGLPPKGLLTRFHRRAASRYHCLLHSAYLRTTGYRPHSLLLTFAGMRMCSIASRSSVSLNVDMLSRCVYCACWLTGLLRSPSRVAGVRSGLLRRNVHIKHPFAFLPTDLQLIPNFRPYTGAWVTYSERKDIRRGIFGGHGNVSVEVGLAHFASLNFESVFSAWTDTRSLIGEACPAFPALPASLSADPFLPHAPCSLETRARSRAV